MSENLDWKALLKPEPKPPEPPADLEPEMIRDLDLRAVGNSIRLAGVVYADDTSTHVVLLPGEGDLLVENMTWPHQIKSRDESRRARVLDLDRDEWTKFLRQTDILETEVLQRSKDGKLAKAILRKSQRQIDTHVSWAVFKRDNYCCRYCGRDGVPLTVDHLVLWEEGGPSIEANLLSACRKCNKTRGNTQYADWLQHGYYKKVSAGLTPEVAAANVAIVATLDAIPRHQSKRSR